jgi:hypothetical protein
VLNRRRFLRYAGGAVGAGIFALGAADFLDPQFFNGALSGGGSTSSASNSSTSTFSESKYSNLPDYSDFLGWLNSVAGPYGGNTLNISLEAEFGSYAVQLIDSDFLGATGINTQYSIKPYSLQLSDVSFMFNTQSPSYDVYNLDCQNLGVFPTDSISPLELAKTYPELTYPGLDLQGFDPFMWDRIATYPPDLSSGLGGTTPAAVPVLPFDTPTMIQFYRTDVYAKLGLALPMTWDEYFDDVKTIQKSGLTPFGAVSQAASDISIVYEYLTHLASFGGDLWTIDGNTVIPNMNNDKAIAALENFVRFEPYSDAASLSYTWDDVFNSIAHGSAATGLLWNGYSAWINDTQRSLVPGKIGYKAVPAGPQGSFSTFVGSGAGVSRFSKSPKTAWLWLQWSTAKGTQEAMMLDQYHVYPTRPSVLDAPAVSGKLDTDPYAAARLTKQIWDSKGVTALIGFPNWFNALVALSNHLNTAWTHAETPSQALAAAQIQIEKLGKLTF